jgi:exopolysaccharide/PEP-CTERM locus tyrosine autokinase
MSQPPKPVAGSLIERAAEAFEFHKLWRLPEAPSAPPEARAQRIEAMAAPAPITDPTLVPVDRDLLRQNGFIVPGSPPTALSEEFRLVKRQLLLAALGGNDGQTVDNGRLILVCSAQPNEGKTFCVVNLALSMASETDIEVLLVDADVAKPEIFSTLGLPGSAGLMDALADPSIDPEQLVIRTDIPNFSVLPAGRQTNTDTELLASGRTRTLIEKLAARNPRRIILFDSAPALAASPASVLALQVGQAVIVVRADRTSEGDLRDAVSLIDSCPNIRLLVNAVTFGRSNRRFGSYYGSGE